MFALLLPCFPRISVFQFPFSSLITIISSFCSVYDFFCHYSNRQSEASSYFQFPSPLFSSWSLSQICNALVTDCSFAEEINTFLIVCTKIIGLITCLQIWGLRWCASLKPYQAFPNSHYLHTDTCINSRGIRWQKILANWVHPRPQWPSPVGLGSVHLSSVWTTHNEKLLIFQGHVQCFFIFIPSSSVKWWGLQSCLELLEFLDCSLDVSKEIRQSSIHLG